MPRKLKIRDLATIQAELDLGDPNAIKVKRYLKERRTASWREINNATGLGKREIMAALQPAKVSADLPCCEAPGCLADGRFGFKPPGFEGLKHPARFYCHVHRDLGDIHEASTT